MLRNSLYIRRASFFAPSIAAIDALEHAVDRQFFHLGDFFVAEYPIGHLRCPPFACVRPRPSLKLAHLGRAGEARRGETGSAFLPRSLGSEKHLRYSPCVSREPDTRAAVRPCSRSGRGTPRS